MTVTFLITVDLPDISPQVLLDEADAIATDLSTLGLNVIDVKPWQRPVTAPVESPQQP